MTKIASLCFCIIVMGTSVVAQTESTPTTDQAKASVAKVSIPLEKLTRLDGLPARYNGRLTNLQSVSQRYAARWAGSQKFQGPEKRQYDASQMYVLLIAGHAYAQEIQCFQVRPDVAKTIGLDANSNDLYSYKQVVTAPQFQNTLESKNHLRPYEEQTQTDQKFREILSNLSEAKDIAASHLTPWGIAANQITALISTAERTSQLDVPRMVFSAGATSGRWKTLLDTTLIEYARIELNEESVAANPYAKTISDLLTAIRNNNLEAFERHSADAFKMLGEREECGSALEFDVPETWMEIGADAPFTLRKFSDANSYGITIARIQAGGGRFNLKVSINHFPKKTIDARCLINSWRLLEGLVPLTESEFSEQVGLGGGQFGPQWTTEFTTPESVPKKRMTTKANVIHHSSGTWVISAFGPSELFKKEAAAMDSFSRSVVIPDTIADWVAADSEPSDELENDTAAFLKSGPSYDLLIQLNGSSTTQEETKRILHVANQLKLSASENPFQGLNPPSNWDLFNSNDHFRGYFIGGKDGSEGTSITLEIIESVNRVHAIELTNLMRHSIGLPLLPNSTIDQNLGSKRNGFLSLPLDAKEPQDPK